MKLLRFLLILLYVVMASSLFAAKAWAFCGFYVAKADAKLYNQASQVAIARHQNRTVVTMANDYQGAMQDFAIVVPVPVAIQKEQVKVANAKVLEHLDAFSAPRLVEYFDPDPCDPPLARRKLNLPTAPQAALEDSRQNGALGVTVEAKFTVGEYDILILSAQESNGLATWLKRNGYKLPRQASRLLRPYIRQKMKFFVAKVNLPAFDQSGFERLRPLQISYDSAKFMLPLRLGMMNAKTAQDLLVYVISAQGRAEVSNYRTVKVPSDQEIPVFVKPAFTDFYKALFQTAYDREGQNVAFLEYAWDMRNCDPCAAEPLSSEELKQAGVFWLEEAPEMQPRRRFLLPPVQDPGVFITRLHVRYTQDKFPEDLIFQETANQDSFQGRYILRHPFAGEASCSAGRRYQRSLHQRQEQERQTLARLTGWDLQQMQRK